MIKKLLLNKNQLILFKIVLLLAVIASFPFFGSDCSNNLNNIIGGTTTGDIHGSWRLTNITGYLQDICANETVQYDSNGTATLTCPNSNPITRTYTLSNNILTYTETNVSYDVTTLTDSVLVLTGRNIGRTLTYIRIPVFDNKGAPIPYDSNAIKNSSENSVSKEH